MHPDSMTQVLSHARKITCAGVRRMRGLSVVLIRSVLLPATTCRTLHNGLSMVFSTRLSYATIDSISRTLLPVRHWIVPRLQIVFIHGE